MSSNVLPSLTSAQVKQVDALCQERFGIPVGWLMEAAGWQVARLVDEPAVVVCGVGNNAGDGFAAARHLHRWGRLARVCCVEPSRMRGPAALELAALDRVGVEIATELSFDGAHVVVDAIFGTGLDRAPEGRFAEWIDSINASGKRVIAIDVPSGLDSDTGEAYAPSVHADLTVTLGLPKPGLRGEFVVVDIGIPLEAYAAIGIEVRPDLYGERIRL
ncbi:MAG TPA: NAD(P)H-hydrate epimerase [Candidatus Dormibacteraeota bacterium]|nr:NAD(P)H-hydrate epimerase [Candidatus Dormibacteraeota bacterium]